MTYLPTSSYLLLSYNLPTYNLHPTSYIPPTNWHHMSYNLPYLLFINHPTTYLPTNHLIWPGLPTSNLATYNYVTFLFTYLLPITYLVHPTYHVLQHTYLPKFTYLQPTYLWLYINYLLPKSHLPSYNIPTFSTHLSTYLLPTTYIIQSHNKQSF
jgi:hypothetical protein